MALLGKDATATCVSAVVAGAPDPEHAAEGVPVVLRGGAVFMSAATAPTPQATRWAKAELAFTWQFHHLRS